MAATLTGGDWAAPAPAIETEVLVEMGEPGMGVSGEVLVTAEDGTSLSSSGFARVISVSGSGLFSDSAEAEIGRAAGAGGGEGGGVDN